MSSFSDFVIMGPQDEEPPPTVVSTPASSTWSLALLGLLSLAALVPVGEKGEARLAQRAGRRWHGAGIEDVERPSSDTARGAFFLRFRIRGELAV